MEIPLWFLPTVTSALLLGFYDIAKKRAVLDNAVAPVIFYANLCGCSVLLLFFLLTGKLTEAIPCSAATRWLLFGKAALVGSSWGLVYYAVRELPISVASPVRASSPVWVFLGGLLLFHEIPTWTQGIAMLAIFTGYAVFALIGKLDNIDWRRHKGIHALLAGTLLGAASALYDKYLMNTLQIPPVTVQFYFSIYLVIVLGAGWLFHHITTAPEKRKKFYWHWSIAATGILLMAADFCYFYAVSTPDVHISILSLVRRSNCIVSFALGSQLFREKHLAPKVAALALILAGVAALALWK